MPIPESKEAALISPVNNSGRRDGYAPPSRITALFVCAANNDYIGGFLEIRRLGFDLL